MGDSKGGDRDLLVPNSFTLIQFSANMLPNNRLAHTSGEHGIHLCLGSCLPGCALKHI